LAKYALCLRLAPMDDAPPLASSVLRGIFGAAGWVFSFGLSMFRDCRGRLTWLVDLNHLRDRAPQSSRASTLSGRKPVDPSGGLVFKLVVAAATVAVLVDLAREWLESIMF
jgi:hypothetical protein